MLKVENVFLEFDGLKAVDDVTLHVEKNSVTALIGPNGAGKTQRAQPQPRPTTQIVS